MYCDTWDFDVKGRPLLRCGGPGTSHLRAHEGSARLAGMNCAARGGSLMKKFVGLALAVLVACGLSFAASSNAPDRPPGIAADRWAPISATLGVVLIPDSDLNAPARLPVGAAGPPPGLAPQSPQVAPIVDRTGLYADPSPTVQAIIDEGRPVRGYVMVKRGKVWRPLVVVPPSVEN